MQKQIIPWNLALITLIAVTISFDTAAQRRQANQNLTNINVPIKTLRVISSKFNSDETNRALGDYRTLMTKNNDPKPAILSLRQKRYSLATIMATVRKNYSGSINLPATSTSSVTNTNIGDDVQLMLKSISDLTAADLLASVQSLYDASDVDLFNISMMAMQDSFQTINEMKGFLFYCDCKLGSWETASSYKPRHANKSMTHRDGNYKRSLYPWVCYNYWNTGLRNLLLPTLGLNGYLTALRKSQYPLYKGMLKEDLADASLDFKVILGNSGDSLYRLMECAALAYQPLANNQCPTELPRQTSTNYNGESNYFGTAYFPYVIKPMCRLSDVLPVIKRNGYTITEIAKAVKKRFSPDEDLKQKILESFDKNIFTNSDLLEVARVLNDN